MNLLITNGVGLLIEITIKMMNTLFLKNFKNTCELQYLMQTIQILSKWLHYFTFCLTLSLNNSKETLSTLIKSIIYKRPPLPTGINIGITLPTQIPQPPTSAVSAAGPANQPSKNSTPSQMTPTFRSPHSSFSDGVKNQSGSGANTSKTQLKTFLVGAEEYETFDEEISNIFFNNISKKDFHKQIYYFVSESQKFQSGIGKFGNYGSIFQIENEGILLNLLEILMVLNDVK